MADSAEADLAADEGEEGARPSSRWARLRPGRRVGYALVALAALVLIALTIAWFSRERIADDVIQGQLDQYDLPATYDIESIGPNRQVLRNIVVGDPADPDLTVARAMVDLRVRPWGTRFGRVTLEKPRLKGTLSEGGISFGTLDRVLFRDTGGEGGLPALDLKIIDGQQGAHRRRWRQADPARAASRGRDRVRRPSGASGRPQQPGHACGG